MESTCTILGYTAHVPSLISHVASARWRVWQHPEALNHMVPQLCLSITTALFLIDTAYHGLSITSVKPGSHARERLPS